MPNDTTEYVHPVMSVNAPTGNSFFLGCGNVIFYNLLFSVVAFFFSLLISLSNSEHVSLFQVFVSFARQQRDEEDGGYENDVDMTDEMQTSAT